jgi:hypothetical protein
MSARAFDPDGLLCALVLAPHAFSRNRFFRLHDNPEARRVRRRAARVRGVIRQLAGGLDRPKGEIVGEQILGDGQVMLRYRVEQLGFSRTVALSAVEASALRYALHRAGVHQMLDPADRALVESALKRLGEGLGLDAVGT